MGLASLNGLHECIVDEDALLLSLNEAVPLASDIFKKSIILGQAGLGDMRFASLNGLHKRIVDEDVLLLSLYEAVSLACKVAIKRKLILNLAGPQWPPRAHRGCRCLNKHGLAVLYMTF
jgi:hypothetical protein